jgi:uncharacterized membrane protein
LLPVLLAVLIPLAVAMLASMVPGHLRRLGRGANRRAAWATGTGQTIALTRGDGIGPVRYPWSWAMPPALIIAVTAVTGILRYQQMPGLLVLHYGANGAPDVFARRSVLTAFGPVIAQVALALLMTGLAFFALRGAAGSEVTDRVRAHARQRWASLMSRALLFLAAFGDLSLFFVALTLWRPSGSASSAVLTAVLATIVGTVGVAALFVYARQHPHRPAPGGAALRPHDADDHWRGGLIYVNRDDPDLFVPKRNSSGATLNLGHPIVWVILVVVLAVPVITSVLVPLAAG